MTEAELNSLILIARKSKDDDGRCRAMSIMSVEYINSGNKGVGNVLAQITRDVSSSDDVRLFAYLLLIDVSKGSKEKYPSPTHIHFPDIVNWTLVDSFL